MSYGTHKVRLTQSRQHIEIIHDGGGLEAGRELISRLSTDIYSRDDAASAVGELLQDASGFIEQHRRQMNTTASIGQVS
jgi:hypothetical protein